MDENLVSLYSDAPYYDLFMGAYATGDCLAYYRQQISSYGEPVLELAYGSGRLTIPLVKAGIDIIRLDISQEMLDFGNQKASEQGVNVTFIKSDMRNFDLGRKFNSEIPRSIPVIFFNKFSVGYFSQTGILHLNQ